MNHTPWLILATLSVIFCLLVLFEIIKSYISLIKSYINKEDLHIKKYTCLFLHFVIQYKHVIIIVRENTMNFDRCYVEEVIEPQATRDSESETLCDHVDDLLERIYNWDTINIDHLDNMLQEYHHLLDMYDYLSELYPAIAYNEIPNHFFKYDTEMIDALIDNELVFGIDSKANYFLRPNAWDTYFFQFSLIKDGEAQ